MSSDLRSLSYDLASRALQDGAMQVTPQTAEELLGSCWFPPTFSSIQGSCWAPGGLSVFSSIWMGSYLIPGFPLRFPAFHGLLLGPAWAPCIWTAPAGFCENPPYVFQHSGWAPAGLTGLLLGSCWFSPTFSSIQGSYWAPAGLPGFLLVFQHFDWAPAGFLLGSPSSHCLTWYGCIG